MTDQHYFDLFGELTSALLKQGGLDDDLFCEIFEGKIKPIIRNVFSDASANFSAVDLDDTYQDLFIKLWSRCVNSYFLDEKYEKSAPMFLGWCKVVIKNHVTSMLRKKSLRTTETLDDPDHPVTVSGGADPSSDLIGKEAVRTVFTAVIGLGAKAPLKLTWFGVYLPIFLGDADDRTAATRRFCKKCGEITYGELFLFTERTLRSFGFGEGALLGLSGEVECGEPPLREVNVGRDLGDDPAARVSDRVYKINKKLATILPPEVTQWDI